MKRFDWVSINGEGVVENPMDPHISSIGYNVADGKFDIFVLDRETGIVYSGAAGDGSGYLADDVKYFIEG